MFMYLSTVWWVLIKTLIKHLDQFTYKSTSTNRDFFVVIIIKIFMLRNELIQLSYRLAYSLADLAPEWNFL